MDTELLCFSLKKAYYFPHVSILAGWYVAFLQLVQPIIENT